MSKINGAVFDFSHIAGMINYIGDIANEEYNLTLTKQAKENTIEYVLSHYYEHIQAYNISVSGSDPYKFLSWSGIYIFKTLYKTNREVAIKFLSSTIVALNRSLKLIDKELPEDYLRKITN